MTNLYDILQGVLLENQEDEGRGIGKKNLEKVMTKAEEVGKEAFGDDYGKVTPETMWAAKRYNANIKNDVDIASGPFAVGNSKLSDDTLIINFTSALGCPSLNGCPVKQDACYAVALENRFWAARRKNVIIGRLFNALRRQNKTEMFFDLAELYIDLLKNTAKPIRYIRYNEVGDFPNQKVLEIAAKFSKRMKEDYGVISMAYTAHPKLHPDAEVDGIPIDQIIAINASREDIPRSKGAIKRNFHCIDMPYKGFTLDPNDPNKNLENSYTDVKEVKDTDLNGLSVKWTDEDDISIPILTQGSWKGGSGYYYVCPCSFWHYNKNKARKEFAVKLGIMKPDDPIPETNSDIKKLNALLNAKQRKELDNLLGKVKSPCGVHCAVCHNMKGGELKSGDLERGIPGITNYTVLTATHGSNASKFDPVYAELLRKGKDKTGTEEEKAWIKKRKKEGRMDANRKKDQTIGMKVDEVRNRFNEQLERINNAIL